MIKVHNVIPLNEVFKEGKSCIYSIGSKSLKSYTPNLNYGELYKENLTEARINSFFAKDISQYSFTYIMKGAILLESETGKHFLNEGDLCMNRFFEETATLTSYEIFHSPVILVQLRLPLDFELNWEGENSRILHGRDISIYSDPVKQYKKLFSARMEDNNPLYIWHITIVPGGRMHIPIPAGKSFAFILDGQVQFSENAKPVSKFNVVSMDSPLPGLELDIINHSSSTHLEFLLLGGSRY